MNACPCDALFNREWTAGERVEKVTHRPDACIYCGACSAACPAGAIKVRKTAILPDMKKKQIFEKSHKIMPQSAALLYSLGVEKVPVYKKIRAGIISTGTEIFNGMIRNTSSVLIQGFMKEMGGESTFERVDGYVITNRDIVKGEQVKAYLFS